MNVKRIFCVILMASLVLVGCNTNSGNDHSDKDLENEVDNKELVEGSVDEVFEDFLMGVENQDIEAIFDNSLTLEKEGLKRDMFDKVSDDFADSVLFSFIPVMGTEIDDYEKIEENGRIIFVFKGNEKTSSDNLDLKVNFENTEDGWKVEDVDADYSFTDDID